MKTFYLIFIIFLSSCYEAHVITDNFYKTIKCERYDGPGPLSLSDSDRDSSIADFDPDIEICSTDAIGKPLCFTIWSNDSTGIEIKKKGCFQAAEDCSGRTSCVSQQKTKSLHFCCCEGDLCNKDFFYEPITLTIEDDEDNQVYDLPTIPNVLLVLAFVVSCLFIAVYAKKNRHYSCIGDKHEHVQVASGRLTGEREGLRPIELLEVKAEGRFGTVWKAKSKNDYVAVKILPTEYYQLWLTEQDVFKLPNMDHENIIRFIAAEDRSSVSPSEFRIITAYQELGSLHDYLKSNTVTWEQLCLISFTMTRIPHYMSNIKTKTLAQQALLEKVGSRERIMNFYGHINSLGLAHLHEEIPCEKSDIFKPSVAHRDFKSANVLLKNDLSACIADFGFAYIFRSAVCDSRHERIGTKRYMAPEVLKGVVGFSSHSFLCMDMYACGLVLWEILSRCSAHEDSENKYRLPYQAELGDNLSFEALQELVVCKKGRPVLKETWKKNTLLSNVCEIIEDCWDQDAEARLSAACVTERFSWYLRSAVKSETKLLYSIP